MSGKKVYPPTTKVTLPFNTAERWRNLVWKCRSPQKTVTLSDADRVMLTHLEVIFDSLMELGSACLDVYNRFQHLDVPSEAGAEVSRVYTAYSRFQKPRKQLEYIDTDLKLYPEKKGR